MNSRAERFLARLMNSPEGQAQNAQDAAAEVAERTAVVEKVTDRRKALAKDLGPARKAVERELGLFEKAREALTAAEMKLRTAQVAEHNLRNRAETEIGQLRRELSDDAIPGFAPFLDGLRNLWDVERRHWPWSHRDQPGSASERIAQIRRVQERVEALQYLPDPVKAEAELAKLKAEIATPEAVAA